MISPQESSRDPAGMDIIRDFDFDTFLDDEESKREAAEMLRPGGTCNCDINVEDQIYRDMLVRNNIHARPKLESLPAPVETLVERMCRDRDSPGPSPEEIDKDILFEAIKDGASEFNVKLYFMTKVFPGESATIQCSQHMEMSKSVVPFSNGTAVPAIRTPAPDVLYGYNFRAAFPEPRQQFRLKDMGSEVRATNQYSALVFPFLVVEFQGVDGNMWVAANRCFGGAAACVNIAESLNRQLRKCQGEEMQAVNSATFSIATNGLMARLYVSWKHDELNYYSKLVGSYLFDKASDYIEFRKTVHNIVDWGKNERLKDIQRALDTIIDDAQVQASQKGKSRQAPRDSSQGDAKKVMSMSSMCN